MRISNALNKTFEIPENSKYFPRDSNSRDSKSGKRSYKYTLFKEGRLFKLERVLDGNKTEVLFDTGDNKFFMSKLYHYIGTDLNSEYLYGFGERRKNFRYNESG